jgi:HEAT repeat protein
MARIWITVALTLTPLAAQPNVTAWDVLKQGLSESNQDKRKQAVLAVATVGPAPEVIALLNEALRDKQILVRQAAAAAIGENKIRACIPNLRAALDDDGEVAFTAAKALWDMGDRNGRDLLQEVYTGQAKTGPNMLEGAVRDAKKKLRNPKTLALMGMNEASGALLGPFSLGITAAQDALKDSGAPTRAYAVTLLSQACDARGIQLMEWSLDADHNHLVRAATAKALAKCGDAAAVDKLIPLMADDNPAVRYYAAAAIVRLSIEKGVGTRASR